MLVQQLAIHLIEVAVVQTVTKGVPPLANAARSLQA